jgi:beta-N-acetylhexosaminidase
VFHDESRGRAGRTLLALLAAVLVGVAGCNPTATTTSAWVPPRTTGSPSPSGTPLPTAPTNPAEDSCVNSILNPMTVPQLAGQVMLVGTARMNPPTNTTGIDTTTILTFASSYTPAGIFIAGRTMASAQTLKAQIATIQHAAKPGNSFLISLDQEGGYVQTLQGPSFPAIDTAVLQGKATSTDLTALTHHWAGRLANIGINLDLAPVADTVPTNLVNINPPIGKQDRQYGSDPTAVAAAITVVVQQIQGTGVLATLKHFPGLGRVTVNTDFATGAVDNTTTADDPYLGPFKAGIQAGAAAVMISLASYPKLDPNTLAAFSTPIVTGLLRQKLGFTGLIISDDLGGAIGASTVPTNQRAVQFIQAGGNLALDTDLTSAPDMIQGLITQAGASSSFAATLKAAATRVLQAKYNAGLLSCSPSPNSSAG